MAIFNSYVTNYQRVYIYLWFLLHKTSIDFGEVPIFQPRFSLSGHSHLGIQVGTTGPAWQLHIRGGHKIIKSFLCRNELILATIFFTIMAARSARFQWRMIFCIIFLRRSFNHFTKWMSNNLSGTNSWFNRFEQCKTQSSQRFHGHFGRNAQVLCDNMRSNTRGEKLDDLGWNGYGSIPINTIFRGMNIHKSQLFWCELQGYKVLTLPNDPLFLSWYDHMEVS